MKALRLGERTLCAALPLFAVVWFAACGDSNEPPGASPDAGAPDAPLPPPPPPLPPPPPPPLPPAPPTGVAASDGTSTTHITIAWTASAGASSYRVWRGGVPIATTSATSYDDQGAGAGSPPSASTLTASDGTHVDRVALSWTAAVTNPGPARAYSVTAIKANLESVPSASDLGHRAGFPLTGYVVHRGLDQIAVVSGLSYDDTEAPGGAPPGQPVVTATQTLLDRVNVAWSTPVVPPGSVATYQIIPLSEVGNGPPSFDNGSRAPAAITKFELSIDGGAFSDVGLTTTQADMTAPAGSIAIGATTASEGTSIPHVIAAQAAASATTNRIYAVRAVSALGAGSAGEATGRRSIGTVRFQWQRSSGDADTDFSDVAGATGATLLDTTAPASGEGRWYRCAVAADGAATIVSPSVRGHRDIALQSAPRDDAWVTNGLVEAVAVANGVVYLGGFFDYIGPPTGSFTALDATSGAQVLERARILGVVRAIEPDGAGGWYVGGEFTVRGAVVRSHLVHVAPSGEVDFSFNPAPNQPVFALARRGTKLYAGGEFTQIGGIARSRIAELDAVTGAATSWNVVINGPVRALAASGNTIYAGGDFSIVNGLQRNRIAALSATAGVTSWNPNANDTVKALQINGGAIYAGGLFTSIGGQARNRIAALDASTAVPTAWDPNVPDGEVSTIAIGGGVVYIGGTFANAGGHVRAFLAALDATTGVATPWTPEPSAPVRSVVVAGNTIYAAGLFGQIGGRSRRFLAALDPLTAAARDWSPMPTGLVNQVAVAGNTVFAGGDFTSAGGVARKNLAAISVATGEPTAWDPGASGRVAELVVAGSLVYAGGDFANIGGQARTGLAAIDATTGVPTPWSPVLTGAVFAIIVDGGRVYAGGTFFTSSASNLVAFDVASGAETSWLPGASGTVFALKIRDNTIYAGGSFSSAGGILRSRLAAFDTTTGAVLSWNPSANGTVQALELGDGVVFAGGSFSTIGGLFRSKVAQINEATGQVTAWTSDSAPHPAVSTIALLGGTLYVGGHSNSGGPLVAYDAAVGTTVTWFASSNFNTATGAVAMVSSQGALYVGGRFTSISQQPRGGLAIFDPQ